MPSTIITKNGSGAPLAADLVAGELAVDLTNGRLYTEDSGGSVIEIGLNPSGNVDVTGTVTADGVISEGNITVDGDGNTRQIGFDFYGSSKYNFFVDGSTDADRMTIRKGTTTVAVFDSTGQVGIGAAPASELHVKGSTPDLRVENTTASETVSLSLIKTATKGFSINNKEISGTNYLTFNLDTAGAGTDAMVIHPTSGNVGIGTSSPATLLNTKGATLTATTDKREILIEAHGDGVNNSKGALTGITFRNSTTTYTAGSFNRTSGVYGLNEDSAGYGRSMGLAFYTATNDATATEAARIDSSGNLLVGVTSTTIPGVGNTTAGVSIRGDDGSFFSRSLGSGDTNNVVSINRSTADGNILGFAKDGSTVGSIGVSGSRPYLANNVNFGIKLDDFGGGQLQPATTAGAVQDAVCSLGNSSVRWKDLYLSGGVVFPDAGGSGNPTSNTLDSYEEGTFTATLRGATEPGTLITTTATYTKIGNRVFIIISFENVNTTGYSGVATIEGLPFNCSQTRAVLYLAAYNGLTWTDTPLATVSSGGSTLGLQDQVSGAVWNNVNHNASSGTYIWATGHYIAT